MQKLLFIFLFFILSINLFATSLREVVVQTINTNHNIIAEHLNQDAFKKYIDEENGDYLPTIDFDSYIQKSKTYDDPDTVPPNEGWSEKDGWNAELKFQHILYDGGLTPSEVREYTHKYLGNRYRSTRKIESIVKDTIDTYLELVKQQELMALSKNNIDIHEEYLKVAKEKEEISGEILESYQVASKHHAILDRYLEYENNWKKSKSKYKKLTGRVIKGNICRPVIHENLIPKSLNEAIELGVRRSHKISEQVEKIREQKEILFRTDSNFKPTVTFELTAMWDDDLELEENGREDVYGSKIYFSWNLFNGGKDKIASQREYIFLQEEKKKLDGITEDVIDEIKKHYNTYFNLKKRIENINNFVTQNANILQVYKRQLEDGTRTFLDILNAESELYRSQIDRLDQEFEIYITYYDFLESISILSDSILADKNQFCTEYKYVNEYAKEENIQEEERFEDLEASLGLGSDKSEELDMGEEESLNDLFINETETNDMEKQRNDRLDSIYSNNNG